MTRCAANGGYQYAYYVNGELVGNLTACAYQACDMGMPVQGGGIIHLGQEADKPWGDFEELQAFTGVLDELRVWTIPRTGPEIQASYQTGITNPASVSADLDFYWKFDSEGLVRVRRRPAHPPACLLSSPPVCPPSSPPPACLPLPAVVSSCLPAVVSSSRLLAVVSSSRLSAVVSSRLLNRARTHVLSLRSTHPPCLSHG